MKSEGTIRRIVQMETTWSGLDDHDCRMCGDIQ